MFVFLHSIVVPTSCPLVLTCLAIIPRPPSFDKTGARGPTGPPSLNSGWSVIGLLTVGSEDLIGCRWDVLLF